MADKNSTHRLPPQAIEAEQAVLGCMLIDPEAVPRVFHTLTGKSFFKPAHSHIFNAVALLFEKNETDLGITLAKGGVSSGPYIVIPIIGPSNLRDFSGDVIEYFVDPISNNVPNREYIAIGNGLNERAEIDEQLDKVRDASSDRYEMIKSIYYQNRNAQLEEEYIQNLPVPKIYIE